MGHSKLLHLLIDIEHFFVWNFERLIVSTFVRPLVERARGYLLFSDRIPFTFTTYAKNIGFLRFLYRVQITLQW